MKTKIFIFTALDNALNNGWDMTRRITDEIMNDIMTYCPELEDEQPDNIQPIVEEWLRFKARPYATFEEWLISREELEEYKADENEAKSYFVEMYDEYLSYPLNY